MSQFYRARKDHIFAANGNTSYLRGVNFGGWLMMEGYFMNALNRPVKAFKKSFAAALGTKTLREFEQSFNDAFITESDFRWVAASGFNMIRLPFHFGLIEKKPYRYDAQGVAYLDRAIDWAAKSNLLVLLDLHAAPGCQNHDWHSDSDGKAELWTKPANQKRTIALWEFLADRYKDNPAVVGYDLLNESVMDHHPLLNAFYKQLIKSIRAVDRNHILFVEGNRWSQDLECLDDFEDDNLVFSIHFYEPLEFTFNFVPQLSYPLKNGSAVWDSAAMRQRLEGYARFARNKGRAVHVGEFGVNARGGLYGEDVYVRDIVSCFKDFGFHWNYWTYKAIKNYSFPDGIFSYYPNPPWVNRPGPKLGWDTYAAHWPTKKKDMIASWSTQAFSLNTHILEALKHGV